MKILNRYITREMIGPTILGFAFYTFVFLMRELFDAAELIIRHSMPLTEVLVILGLSLPHIVVLTLPMALLFGILIAIGRLSSDSEVVAMRSAGISTSVIYRPVLLFSGIFFVLNLLLINLLTPIGNEALQERTREIAAASMQGQIEPRVFYDELEDLVVYVDDVDPATGVWKGIFLSNRVDPSRQDIVIARTGQLERDEEAGNVWLRLEDATSHQYDPDEPDSYHVSQQAVQEIAPPGTADITVQEASKSFREMTIPELVESFSAENLLPIDRRTITVEIHKKFSIPFACIAFGIIALPLGITNRRGGRSSGVTVSIGVILLYYILLSNGEDLARSGNVPAWLGIWFPNMLLVGTGIFLLRRANRDLGARDTKPGKWLRSVASSFRKRKKSDEDDPSDKRAEGAVSRLDMAFPNTLDRYILSQFLKVLLAVLVSTAVLFIIVDYTEIADEISEFDVSWSIVASYYRYYVIQVLDLILPLSILLATMITFGIFSRNSEITAMKANGVSLYRISVPIIMVAAIASGISYLLQDFILPYSNERVHELQSRIKGRETARAFGEQRQWIFGNGRYLFNFLEFDERADTLKRVQVFEFHPSEFRLTRRVLAEEA
ncbi:MAG: LPS export ABC transporter permease LptF, partial [Thermoanaerobaculia bacterium]|nr:LPS export ABC transporter permease LptF [Thermoanaerobaculia bacterium]